MKKSLTTSLLSLSLSLLLISAASCQHVTQPPIKNEETNPFCSAVGEIPDNFIWDDVEQSDESADFFFNYGATFKKYCPQAE